MGEVMLSTELPGSDAAGRSRFERALASRRWEPVRGHAGLFVCHFEHGFIAEVRRIVHQDLIAAVASARCPRFRAAHVWSAPGHVSLSAGTAPGLGTPGTRTARRVWTDGGEPVGPVADVLLRASLDRADPGAAAAFLRALGRRGWIAIEGLPLTLRHPFDLGMFEPIASRVAEDLNYAAAPSGRSDWRAVFAQSTWDHTRLEGPPPAREIRPLPWDRDR